MFQFHSYSLLIALLLYHCSNLCNNNYNYNSLSDTTILNCQLCCSLCNYNLLVIDNFLLIRYSRTSNKQLVLTRCYPKHFSFSIALFRHFIVQHSLMSFPMDGSRSRLLEKSFAKVCICSCHACLYIMLIVVV